MGCCPARESDRPSISGCLYHRCPGRRLGRSGSAQQHPSDEAICASAACHSRFSTSEYRVADDSLRRRAAHAATHLVRLPPCCRPLGRAEPPGGAATNQDFRQRSAVDLVAGRALIHVMCNLYSITTNQAAIIALFHVMNRYVGNLPPMRGVFPEYAAPVVRNAGAERELTMMRWGMPPPLRAHWRPPGHEHPQCIVAAPARLAEAGKPLPGPF